MSRKSVLVVDDEDDIREVLAMTLEMVGGYDVATASGGEDGYRQARLSPPDLILLDVMMPSMDGPATLANLRRDPVTALIPVIFLTAKVQAADRSLFRELGATGMIAKPFDPLTLPSEIVRILGW